jgi:hypothetical protein
MGDLASGEKIFVWQSRGSTTLEQVVPLLHAIRRRGPNTLLWVTEADERHAPGSVENLGSGLLKGYVVRFAPYDNATDINASSWFEVCHRAYAALHGVHAHSAADVDVSGHAPNAAISLTHAAPSELGSTLRSWLRSTVNPRTTAGELRVKGRHFLAEAAKATDGNLRSELRALAYIHFETADDLALRHCGE